MEAMGASSEDIEKAKSLEPEFKPLSRIIDPENSRIHTNLFPYVSYFSSKSSEEFNRFMTDKGYFKSDVLSKYETSKEGSAVVDYPVVRIPFRLDNWLNPYEIIQKIPSYTTDKYLVFTLAQFTNEFEEVFSTLLFSVQTGNIQSYAADMTAEKIISKIISGESDEGTLEFFPYGYKMLRTATEFSYDDYSLGVVSFNPETYEQSIRHIENPSVSSVQEVLGKMTSIHNFAVKLNV